MSSGEYPEELVELVARAIAVDQGCVDELFNLVEVDPIHYPDTARAVLDALSSAGRLVPHETAARELAKWRISARTEVIRRSVITTPWTPAEPAQRSGVAAQEQDRTEERL